MKNLHRNNAAEWIMYAALLPVMSIAWAWAKLKVAARRS
jgi:hypothetical protein